MEVIKNIRRLKIDKNKFTAKKYKNQKGTLEREAKRDRLIIRVYVDF